MKAGAVVLLGLVLATPAWGHSDDALLPQLHSVPETPECNTFQGGQHRSIEIHGSRV